MDVQRGKILVVHDSDEAQTHKKRYGSALDGQFIYVFANSENEASTYYDSVVPECHIVLPPLEPDMRLLGRGNKLIQVADDGVAFHLGDTNDLGDEAWIKETLPAGDGMRADEWVCSGDMITAGYSASRNRVIVLHFRGVQSRE